MNITELITEIKGDLNPKDNGLRSFFKSYFFNPSFRLLYNHRLTKYFISTHFKIPKGYGIWLLKKQLLKRSCQISPKAKLGKNLNFPHPIGIVIGTGVVVQDNVKIWQQVTLGSHGKSELNQGYPVIGKNVKIFTGAKIIGSINIGDNSIIGANAVVIKDIPENCTAVGIPARILKKNK
jgi:serine O-acetyltransferase